MRILILLTVLGIAGGLALPPALDVLSPSAIPAPDCKVGETGRLAAAPKGKAPDAKDYERIFEDFFAADHVDLTKGTLDSQLKQIFGGSTPNGLFKLLKLREHTFGAAIHVGPVVEDNKAFVVVSARIWKEGAKKKVLYESPIFIVFSAEGRLVDVRRGPTMWQEQ